MFVLQEVPNTQNYTTSDIPLGNRTRIDSIFARINTTGVPSDATYWFNLTIDGIEYTLMDISHTIPSSGRWAVWYADNFILPNGTNFAFNFMVTHNNTMTIDVIILVQYTVFY
ncbi:MAG: hypothetical protein ACTSO9_15120 [Candidatus Helarchaeota archaeon]